MSRNSPQICHLIPLAFENSKLPSARLALSPLPFVSFTHTAPGTKRLPPDRLAHAVADLADGKGLNVITVDCSDQSVTTTAGINHHSPRERVPTFKGTSEARTRPLGDGTELSALRVESCVWFPTFHGLEHARVRRVECQLNTATPIRITEGVPDLAGVQLEIRLFLNVIPRNTPIDLVFLQSGLKKGELFLRSRMAERDESEEAEDDSTESADPTAEQLAAEAQEEESAATLDGVRRDHSQVELGRVGGGSTNPLARSEMVLIPTRERLFVDPGLVLAEFHHAQSILSTEGEAVLAKLMSAFEGVLARQDRGAFSKWRDLVVGAQEARRETAAARAPKAKRPGGRVGRPRKNYE